MTRFSSFADLRRRCLDLPGASDTAAAAVVERQAQLTKPPGSLGRLEDMVAWLACWQRRRSPRLERVEVLVFAGTHGVTTKGVSAYPAEVTAQMVANFAAGGAAINQLAKAADAALRVVPLSLEAPTADFSEAPAMSEGDFLDAVAIGFDNVAPGTDLLCLGEMGIGNTTAAAAMALGLFGGKAADWAGRGTGIDDAGLARKVAVLEQAAARHSGSLGDPLSVAAVLGGRELAALLGAAFAARMHGVPVLLDGYVCTAAVAPLALLHASGLAHAQAAHRSAEPGHRRLLERLRLEPLLDLGMRLGEASGACLAIGILRSALACHVGMASFAQAGVSSARDAGHGLEGD